ncbi:MAG TPA: class I SAM-dependent methyltransferase [Coleofasciculaceae cyanobacterium]
MIDDRNQKTYTAAQVVRHYAQLQKLQPAEQTIFEQLRSRLPVMNMLDMGVGGGRTTQHFASRVKGYVGIDYSAEMIAACQRRFAPIAPKIRFEVCDARDLSQFANDSFDLILFSFNGIDYVSHCDRLKVLREVYRVGRPGGCFVFSSHNLQSLEQQFNWGKQVSWNPITTYTNLVMLGLLRWFNRAIDLENLEESVYKIVRDESHNFQLQTYYIRPSTQIQQLTPYFQDVKIFSWQSGRELTTPFEINTHLDQWLYYQCTIGNEL